MQIRIMSLIPHNWRSFSFRFLAYVYWYGLEFFEILSHFCSATTFKKRALDMKIPPSRKCILVKLTLLALKKSKLYFKQLQKSFSIPFALHWSTFLVPRILTCRVNHDPFRQKTEHSRTYSISYYVQFLNHDRKLTYINQY